MPKSTKSTAIKKERDSTKKLKKDFIERFNGFLGNISIICKSLNINRGTYYLWMEKDKEFKEQVEEGREALIDHVEDKLLNRIDSGDTTAIIFFLKTRGRNRGYIETIQHEGSESKPLRLMLVSDNPNDKNSKNRS